MASPRTVVLAIVTNDQDITLMCTTSLLRLQQVAARRGDCLLDVRIVATFLEALNTFEAGDFVVIVDGACGVPPEFVLGVLDAPHEAIAGVYPLPKIDWDRVSKTLETPGASEPLQHAGNVYNLEPAQGPLKRYVPVKTVRDLKVLALSSKVLRQMAGPSNSYLAEDGSKHYLFTHDSVFENALQNQYQTLARRLPVPLVADLELPCVMTGPAQFAGCVGMRGSVR